MRVATQKAINEAVKTAFAADNTLPPAVFINQPASAAPGGAYVKLSLAFGDTESAAVGKQMERTMVVLFAQVFIPNETGSRAAMLVADKLKALFPIGSALSYVNGANPVTATSHQGPNGPTSAGFRDGWQQQNISLVFRVDEVTG